jgi:uncharacterized protein YutE (UPF0331/DUF86 family)
MEKMAKFRNVIVHHYDKVDTGIVIGILRNDLKDFVAFKNAILKAIKEQ